MELVHQRVKEGFNPAKCSIYAILLVKTMQQQSGPCREINDKRSAAEPLEYS